MPKILPEDVPFRAVLPDTQLVEQLVEVPTIVSCSWLQLCTEQNVDIPVPGRGGESLVFKVFPLNRVQQRCMLLRNAFLSGLWSRSLISPFLVEAFKIFAQDRVHPLLRTFQVVFLKSWMSLAKGVFALCPKMKKSAKFFPHSGSDLSADFTSSTPVAQLARTTWYDEEREQAWCRFEDSSGRFYWNLLTTDHSPMGALVGAQAVTVPQFQFFDKWWCSSRTCERWLGCGFSQPLCTLCAGAACQSWRLFGRISSSAFALPRSRCSHWEIWTLRLCPRIFQPLFWCLGVACGVQRIGCFGRSCVLATCGYMFFEKIWNNFSHFLRCGELESRNVWPPFFLNGKCTQSMLLVGTCLVGQWIHDTCSASASRGYSTNFTHSLWCGGLVSCSVVSVCSADASVSGLFRAAHTWKSEHYFYERSIFDSLATFFEPSVMKSSSSSRAPWSGGVAGSVTPR